MQVVFSEISVVGKPVSSEELDAMSDNNFGRNGCIADDKWLWGTQFALCGDDWPDLDELKFRQLVYMGNRLNAAQEFLGDMHGAQQLIIDNLPEEWAAEDEEGETPLYKRLRSELGLPEGDHNRLHIVYNALVYPMAEDSYWDNFEEMYEGLYNHDKGRAVRSSWGDCGEVRVEEREDPIDPDTFLGVVVTYRIASIDEKYVKWMEYENEVGEKVREQRVDLETYLASDDFAAAEDDDNYIDRWEYAAYGAMTAPVSDDDEDDEDE